MNFTHFYEMILHLGICHCSRSNGPKYANTETQDWTELSLQNNVYIAKFSVNALLEH